MPHEGGSGHGGEPRCAYRTLRENQRLLCTPQDLHRIFTDCGDDERDG